LPEAAAHLTRSLGILRRASGAGHPDVAIALHNLAEVDRERGQLDPAERGEQEALAIWQAAYGLDHPNTAVARSGLAQVTLSRGRVEDARAHLALAIATRDRLLAVVLAGGSELQKRELLRRLQPETSFAVSLQRERLPRDPEALRLAVGT